MKVPELFQKGEPTLSFEFFPPKTPEQEERLFSTLKALQRFDPDFVSVTYGAMGRSREMSFTWVDRIKRQYAIEPVAHLTCVNAGRDDIARQLDEFDRLGVTNILALRGDPPEGEKDFTPPADGFKLAKELVAFIKQRKPHFTVGVAGFPEGHPRSASLDADVDYLKQKIAAGAEYVITQLFFDNQHYFAFLKRCRQAGITVPIVPGLMPITNLGQIKKMTAMSGASIPPELLARLEKNPMETLKIGGQHTVAQAHGLLTAGVPGLHFFVLNQAEPISTILSQLNS
ncbi:MAG: methylenetetrahydrofolate reductase [NAD(P)H] [Candidatus Margulisbacteria bacterium]|jgi:methylenetetrahydrofolate reductase (NADPH)|nr:methylenetetrahydrofolate reductase [NAD(P)H] [Candidatus Margulisiibacteriota bacterium]